MGTDKVQARVVPVPGWEQYSWLRHGFSTRAGGVSTIYGSSGEASAEDGDLNLGFTKDDLPAAVRENRGRFVEAIGGNSASQFVTVRQVHGASSQIVRDGEARLVSDDGRALVEADGLITAVPGILLGIQVADCVPVLVADVRRRVVAAFHAGWRGSVAAIVEQGVTLLREQFGTQPADLIGAIGPSIRSCCYSVGEEVRGEFARAFSYADALFEQRSGAMYVSLAEANRRQLLDAGVPEESISVLPDCTGCTRRDGRRKYFSHRMEQGFTGRSMGVIGVASSGR